MRLSVIVGIGIFALHGSIEARTIYAYCKVTDEVRTPGYSTDYMSNVTAIQDSEIEELKSAFLKQVNAVRFGRVFDDYCPRFEDRREADRHHEFWWKQAQERPQHYEYVAEPVAVTLSFQSSPVSPPPTQSVAPPQVTPPITLPTAPSPSTSPPITSTSRGSATSSSTPGKLKPPLAKVAHCAKYARGPRDQAFLTNVCKGVKIQVTFCYVANGDLPMASGDYLDCAKGSFGSTEGLNPGQRATISSSTRPILTFTCPYPEGALNLGQGVGYSIPVTPSTKYTCERLFD